MLINSKITQWNYSNLQPPQVLPDAQYQLAACEKPAPQHMRRRTKGLHNISQLHQGARHPSAPSWGWWIVTHRSCGCAGLGHRAALGYSPTGVGRSVRLQPEQHQPVAWYGPDGRSKDPAQLSDPLGCQAKNHTSRTATGVPGKKPHRHHKRRCQQDHFYKLYLNIPRLPTT